MCAGRESFIKPITGPTVLRDRVNERIFGLQFSAGYRRFDFHFSTTVIGAIEMPAPEQLYKLLRFQLTFAR